MSKTNDVIERMARSLYDVNKALARKYKPGFVMPPYQHDENGFYAQNARAALIPALDAMAKPSEAMLSARFDSHCPIFGARTRTPADLQDGVACYQAMVAQFRKEVLGDD